MTQTKSRSLRDMLAADEFIIAPGVYDMLSALIADRMGFPALYMTGYGVSASHLGLPDAGCATYTEMVGRVQQIVEGTQTPLIADADTGYGGLINVRRTVRGYEAAGAQAIQLEDQEMPKKCGHTPGRRVVPVEEMVLKLRVALDSRRSADTLIVARTDARTTLGIDEALRRAEAYAKAGADIIFVESPETEEELARIGKEIDGKLLVNVISPPVGRTPLLPPDRLRALGFNIAIYPLIGLQAAAKALWETFRNLHQSGEAAQVLPPRAIPPDGADDLHDLVGFPEVRAFERKYNMNS